MVEGYDCIGVTLSQITSISCADIPFVAVVNYLLDSLLSWFILFVMPSQLCVLGDASHIVLFVELFYLYVRTNVCTYPFVTTVFLYVHTYVST